MSSRPASRPATSSSGHRCTTIAMAPLPARSIATSPRGQSLILEIDVQGAPAVKERFPEAVLIFIEPPSLDVLRERLLGRGSETQVPRAPSPHRRRRDGPA
ncbi:MAG: hypothetical protein ACLTSX_14615 [Collinsella sp.]